jgi:hypothetical protein
MVFSIEFVNLSIIKSSPTCFVPFTLLSYEKWSKSLLKKQYYLCLFTIINNKDRGHKTLSVTRIGLEPMTISLEN